MKYKVIGWTNYENYEIPFSNKTIGFSERNAIIDEIKKHQYLLAKDFLVLLESARINQGKSYRLAECPQFSLL